MSLKLLSDILSFVVLVVLVGGMYVLFKWIDGKVS